MDTRILHEKPTKRLLREIQSLDVIAFSMDEPIPISWYIKNYQKLDWITVARGDNGEMVGYRIVTGLVDVVYEAIKMGFLTGDHSLSNKSYVPMGATNKYYLASTAVHPDYRRMGLAKSMSNEAIRRIRDKHKTYELLSIAVSDGGARLGKSLGLRMINMVDSRRIMHGSFQS